MKQKMIGQARISAWSAMGKPAPGEAIEPGVAVLSLLQQSWLRAHFYSQMLRKQVEETGPGLKEMLTIGDEEVQASGLIGYRYGAAGKDGTIYATNEEVRALVSLEASERDRAVKYAKTAHDMGISDRLTAMAERWGDVVVAQIMLLMLDLELSPAQQLRVPDLVQKHLGAIQLEGSIEP